MSDCQSWFGSARSNRCSSGPGLGTGCLSAPVAPLRGGSAAPSSPTRPGPESAPSRPGSASCLAPGARAGFAPRPHVAHPLLAVSAPSPSLAAFLPPPIVSCPIRTSGTGAPTPPPSSLESRRPAPPSPPPRLDLPPPVPSEDAPPAATSCAWTSSPERPHCLVLGFIPSFLSLHSVREKEGRLLGGYADNRQRINRRAQHILTSVVNSREASAVQCEMRKARRRV